MPDISSSLSKREVNARQNTYTKSEIDLKDGAIQAIAEAAQTTADAAEKKNQEQDQLIAELQKSSHSHSNQDVLDKTEQPYTTAERDKLAGLENYTHPTYTAHAKGFYKFASDGKGHVTDAEKVIKKDITDLGIPGEDTNTTYSLVPYGIGFKMRGSDGSSSAVGLKQTITKRLYGWITHELNTDDNGEILIDAYLGASPVRWDSILAEPTKVEVGYDVGGQVRALITDFANDILVYNVVSQNCSATATGKQNLVEGNANKVYGNNNLVGGEHNQITAHGCSSVVSGYGLYCDAVNQTVLGRYNAKDAGSADNAWNSYYGKYVLIIGNGSDSGTGRSNAFAVDWDGNLWCGKDKKSLNAQVASKQDKLTAGTNITIDGNTINAKDTTYSDATQSAHGLMTAADKKKLDGIAAGATKVAVDSALSATSTNPVQNKVVKAALDSKSASGHTHAMITNSMLLIAGANNVASWVRLGTLVSGGDARSAIIRVWSGNGYNAGAYQNASFEIQIKDGWQSTQSAAKACGVTVYRINCGTVKVKVIPTAHNTYVVWVYLPWAYWNGNYAVYGKYSSWVSQDLRQTAEPDGTGADTDYYDHAFITSTVAAAKTLTDSGWTAMTVEGYAKSGTVKYRTYGKQITITGSVVLKADIATSYPAPQYIASTTFDFSGIVGCSGAGRSSSGVGAYVVAENYSGDNIVCVYALGSKIAAGSTLNFTITGFID